MIKGEAIKGKSIEDWQAVGAFIAVLIVMYILNRFNNPYDNFNNSKLKGGEKNEPEKKKRP